MWGAIVGVPMFDPTHIHVQTWLEDVGRFQPRNLLLHHTGISGMKLTRLVLYLQPMLLWWQQIWDQKMTIGIRFYVSTGACGLSGVGCQWYHISPAKFYYVMLRGVLFNWRLVMKYKSHRVPSSQVHSNGREKTEASETLKQSSDSDCIPMRMICDCTNV